MLARMANNRLTLRDPGVGDAVRDINRARNVTAQRDPARIEYTHHGLHRLQDAQRGTLNAGKTALTSETFAQCWTLDSTGNWQGFREDDNGDGAWNLIQSRTANKVNEITDITISVGSAWADPVYSRAGNMTTMPQPADPTNSYTATYDAWNRLTKITDGADTVAAYQYDGAKRRIVQQTYTSGVLSETRHLYYTEPSMWQVIEERLGTATDAERQLVWGLRYMDDLILRDHDTDIDGSLNERLYASQDATFNVTSVANTTGAALQRCVYSAYGLPTFLSASFAQSSSSVDWNTLFCGYRYDSEVGLFHVRHRQLHPRLGVWMQRDPFRGYNHKNLYEYCDSRPTVIVDTYGLFGFGLSNEECNQHLDTCEDAASEGYDVCIQFQPVGVCQAQLATQVGLCSAAYRRCWDNRRELLEFHCPAPDIVFITFATLIALIGLAAAAACVVAEPCGIILGGGAAVVIIIGITPDTGGYEGGGASA